jgi:hypothetical protein
MPQPTPGKRDLARAPLKRSHMPLLVRWPAANASKVDLSELVSPTRLRY